MHAREPWHTKRSTRCLPLYFENVQLNTPEKYQATRRTLRSHTARAMASRCGETSPVVCLLHIFIQAPRAIAQQRHSITSPSWCWGKEGHFLGWDGIWHLAVPTAVVNRQREPLNWQPPTINASDKVASARDYFLVSYVSISAADCIPCSLAVQHMMTAGTTDKWSCIFLLAHSCDGAEDAALHPKMPLPTSVLL